MRGSAWLILPTYNEVQNIETLLKAVAAVRDTIVSHTLSIVVVDSNSPDGTADVVRKLITKRRHKQLHLIIEERRGLGQAYDTGFAYAIKRGADVVIEMDSDLSHDPKELPKLLSAISGGADLAIGSRYVHGGFIPGDWPMLRVVNSKVARYIARHIGGVSKDIADPTAGYRAIRVSALAHTGFVAKGATGYVIQVKMADLFRSKGYNVVELPIAFADRQFGESKIRFKDIRQFFVFCFKLRYAKIRHKQPNDSQQSAYYTSAEQQAPDVVK